MKKTLLSKIGPALLVIIVLLFSGNVSVYSQARRVELTPFGGYLLGGSIKFYEGKFKIEDNACYGGNLAFEVHKGTFVELSYTRMDTKGDWHPYSNYSIQYPDKTVNLAVNYLQIGSLSEFPLDNDKVRPYGTFTLGTTWLHPKEGSASDEWLFAFAAGLGLKYFFSDRVGIRIQARLLLPVIYNGSGFYLGVGTGGASSGVYVSSTTPIVQGDFTGGLIIALGK
jgi:hypothetical protein